MVMCYSYKARETKLHINYYYCLYCLCLFGVVVSKQITKITLKNYQKMQVPFPLDCEPMAEAKRLLVNKEAPWSEVPWSTPEKLLTHTSDHKWQNNLSIRKV